MTHFARALGAARSGDAASAQKREPNRLRGYYGAGLAASQAGERAKAKEHFGRLVAMAGKGEPRPELSTARAWLAAN
jgi:uncharacterized protein HemY